MSDAPNIRTPAQWLSHWTAFKKSHPVWVAKLPAGEAAYVLPEAIVDELASPRGGHRHLKPLLTKTDAQAERDFEKVCRWFGPWVIGVCDDGPLQFPLLFESWNDEAKSIQTESQIIEDGDGTSFAQGLIRTHQQQLAYAGSLSFHRPYRTELELLKRKWLSLPEPRPQTGPWIPARAALNLLETETDDGYYQVYDTFRSRWHLGMLVSWDVPWPMGPIEGIPSQLAATLYGQAGELSYYPPYVDTPGSSIRGKEQLARQLAEIFRALPEPPPMQGIVQRGPDPSEHGTSFRMWLFELTIRRRYGNLRGLPAAIIRGFAKHVSRNEDHVKRLRRAYSDFLTS